MTSDMEKASWQPKPPQSRMKLFMQFSRSCPKCNFKNCIFMCGSLYFHVPYSFPYISYLLIGFLSMHMNLISKLRIDSNDTRKKKRKIITWSLISSLCQAPHLSHSVGVNYNFLSTLFCRVFFCLSSNWDSTLDGSSGCVKWAEKITTIRGLLRRLLSCTFSFSFLLSVGNFSDQLEHPSRACHDSSRESSGDSSGDSITWLIMWLKCSRQAPTLCYS